MSTTACNCFEWQTAARDARCVCRASVSQRGSSPALALHEMCVRAVTSDIDFPMHGSHFDRARGSAVVPAMCCGADGRRRIPHRHPLDDQSRAPLPPAVPGGRRDRGKTCRWARGAHVEVLGVGLRVSCGRGGRSTGARWAQDGAFAAGVALSFRSAGEAAELGEQGPCQVVQTHLDPQVVSSLCSRLSTPSPFTKFTRNYS